MAFDPMIFVDDVEASSRWYQALLGFSSGHGGPHYEMLMQGKDLVLQLHPAEADEHGDLRLPPGAPRGAGLLLYFRTDDIRVLHARALALDVECEGPPIFIEQARHTEFIVRVPGGCAIAFYQSGSA